ncbi:MAG: Hsp20/alpha crystallin family protein [Candidatus Hermodarchaeota archaeon]
MTDDEKDKKIPRFPFDFNFNDFLKQFENQFRNLKELMDSNTLEPGQPMVWGYSTHIGPDGVPRVRQFGNVNYLNPEHSQQGSQFQNEFEPFYDILVDEEANEVVVIVEVPGISKDELELHATDDAISLKSLSPQYKYRTIIPLDHKIDPLTTKASLNNGVLEIITKILRSDQKKGTKISISD